MLFHHIKRSEHAVVLYLNYLATVVRKTSKNYFICHLCRFTSRQQKQMRRILSLPIRRCRRRWLLKCSFAENALQSQLKPKRCTHAHSQVAICVFVIYLSVADINNFSRKMVALGTRDGGTAADVMRRRNGIGKVIAFAASTGERSTSDTYFSAQNAAK